MRPEAQETRRAFEQERMHAAARTHEQPAHTPTNHFSAAFTVTPIKLAIVAMGGEGGGVLADWIVATAEHAGFYAQTTSVPGVAQRTGATIYYLEILPVPRSEHPAPVLGLMPVPGDVDIVLASELMESARAVQRGLVSKDKTLLIASSNRVYALPEKMALGDGRKDPQALHDASQQAAREFVCCDFAALAAQHGSVISATLLGALAASGALPLARQDFEATITRSGVSVQSSLAAFAAGWQACAGTRTARAAPHTAPPALPQVGYTGLTGLNRSDPRLAGVLQRLCGEFGLQPQEAAYQTLLLGAARTIDYQDVRYANAYLDLLQTVARGYAEPPGGPLLNTTARHLALWMTYEDSVRVAELKIRPGRFERVRQEHIGTLHGKQHAQNRTAPLLHLNEFFHPRVEEIADTLPAGLGRWLLRTRWARALVERATRRGRIIRSNRLSGFLLLYALASLRGTRRRSLRYQREHAAIRDWLALIETHATTNVELACEIAACQTLIKGYGDTHARGWVNYQRIVAALPALMQRTTARADVAAQVAALRQAALADEDGSALQALLDGLQSGLKSSTAQIEQIEQMETA